MRSRYLASLIFFLLSMYSIADYASSKLYTIGTYVIKNDSGELSDISMLLESDENHWRPLNTLKIPGNLKDVRTYSGSCFGANCTIIGIYSRNWANDGFVILTNQTDDTWKPIDNIPFPKDFNGFGYDFPSMKCGQEQCVISGSYESNKDNSVDPPLRPLFLIGKNDRWKLSPPINLPSDLDKTESIYPDALTCTAQLKCVSLQHYYSENPTIEHFLLLIKHDDKWENAKNVHLPSDYVSGSLMHVDCMEKQCVATGEYTSAIDQHFHPLILVGADDTWSYESVPNDVVKLNTVQCAKDQCFIIGKSASPFPIILMKKNNSWSSAPITYPPDITVSEYTHLNSISKRGSVWVAIGEYLNTEKHGLPLILTGDGNSWRYVSQVDVPADFDGGAHLYHIYCAHLPHCIILGNYHSKSSPTFFIGYPFILIETENGWKIPKEFELPVTKPEWASLTDLMQKED